jgi:hypothetical protein
MNRVSQSQRQAKLHNTRGSEDNGQGMWVEWEKTMISAESCAE